jgi:hypothetical protein
MLSKDKLHGRIKRSKDQEPGMSSGGSHLFAERIRFLLQQATSVGGFLRLPPGSFSLTRDKQSDTQTLLRPVHVRDTSVRRGVVRLLGLEGQG